MKPYPVIAACTHAADGYPSATRTGPGSAGSLLSVKSSVLPHVLCPGA
jgi:hypothetical protein